jgi:hypothetical protein
MPTDYGIDGRQTSGCSMTTGVITPGIEQLALTALPNFPYRISFPRRSEVTLLHPSMNLLSGQVHAGQKKNPDTTSASEQFPHWRSKSFDITSSGFGKTNKSSMNRVSTEGNP